MTEDEKRLVVLTVRVVEHLLLENFALKVVLQTNPARDWQSQVSRLLADPAATAKMRDTFRDIYEQIDQAPDLSKAVATLLQAFPASSKSN